MLVRGWQNAKCEMVQSKQDNRIISLLVVNSTRTRISLVLLRPFIPIAIFHPSIHSFSFTFLSPTIPHSSSHHKFVLYTIRCSQMNV